MHSAISSAEVSVDGPATYVSVDGPATDVSINGGGEVARGVEVNEPLKLKQL